MACVAFRLFSWGIPPSGCFHSVCRLKVVFTAFFAQFQLAISSVCRLQVVFSAQRLSSLGCFYGVCRLPVSHFWRVSLYFALHLVFIAHVAYNLFSWHVPPSSCFHGVCRLKVSGISSFRRFQTSFYNVLCPHFFFNYFYFRRGCRS